MDDALRRPTPRALPRVAAWVDGAVPGADGELARRARARDPGQGARPPARPAARRVAVAHGHLRHAARPTSSSSCTCSPTRCPRRARYGRMILEAVQAVMPSFVARVERPDRGGEWVAYLERRERAADRWVAPPGPRPRGRARTTRGPSVRLLHVDGDEDALLAALLFEAAGVAEEDDAHPPRRARRATSAPSCSPTSSASARNRRHRPGRGFEALRYRFEIVSDYGAFRDLQRHRMLTVQWQRADARTSAPACPRRSTPPAAATPTAARSRSRAAEWERLAGDGREREAPYALCLGYRIRYVLDLNAREAMQLIELRSGREGHPSYRAVAHEMHRLIGAGPPRRRGRDDARRHARPSRAWSASSARCARRRSSTRSAGAERPRIACTAGVATTERALDTRAHLRRHRGEESRSHRSSPFDTSCAVCRTVATACAPWGEIARCLPAHCSSPARGATPKEWTSPTAAARCSSAASSCSATTPSSASPRAPATSSRRSSCARSRRGTSGASEGDEEAEASAAAGHSLGEYAALVAAGALQFEDAVRLVDERAAAMADAGERNAGGMIAMLGGDGQSVRALAARLGLMVANDNAPGQLVLSGAVDALDEAEDVARDEAGARARRLDVTGAFHSPLMEPAADRLRAALDGDAGRRAEHPGLLQRQRRALRRRARASWPRTCCAPCAGARRCWRCAPRASSASSSSAPARSSPASSSEPFRRLREHGGHRRAHAHDPPSPGAWRPSAGAA